MTTLLPLLNSFSEPILSFFSNSLVGFVLLILLVDKLISRANRTIFGAWVANITGVFFHELAHFLVGKLLNAKPVNFVVFPKKVQLKDGATYYMLGHVDFSNLKWYNAVPSAIAPIFLILIAIFIENNFFIYFDKTLTNFILYIYLLMVFIINAMPSSQDFKVMFSSSVGLVLWTIIICVIFIYSEKITHNL